MWAEPDVFGLFSVSVGSFLDNLGWGRAIFSQNVGMKLRCSRADRFTFAGRYTYDASQRMAAILNALEPGYGVIHAWPLRSAEEVDP
jgi:hypothetical protein